MFDNGGMGTACLDCIIEFFKRANRAAGDNYICTNLRSAEPARLHGGLYSLRVLCKVHQYRRERVGPLHHIVEETFPLLFGLLLFVGCAAGRAGCAAGRGASVEPAASAAR